MSKAAVEQIWHIRQSMPDSGLGFQSNARKTLQGVSSSLGSGTGVLHTRKRTPLGPYLRPVPRVLWGFQGGGRFLMGEVPLCPSNGERAFP